MSSLQGHLCLRAWTSVVPSAWKVFSGPLHEIPPPLRSSPGLPNLNLILLHFLSYLFVSCLLPIFPKVELTSQEGRDFIHRKVSSSWHRSPEIFVISEVISSVGASSILIFGLFIRIEDAPSLLGDRRVFCSNEATLVRLMESSWMRPVTRKTTS